MWQWRAQSHRRCGRGGQPRWCRCGTGGPSPGADAHGRAQSRRACGMSPVTVRRRLGVTIARARNVQQRNQAQQPLRLQLRLQCTLMADRALLSDATSRDWYADDATCTDSNQDDAPNQDATMQHGIRHTAAAAPPLGIARRGHGWAHVGVVACACGSAAPFRSVAATAVPFRSLRRCAGPTRERGSDQTRGLL